MKADAVDTLLGLLESRARAMGGRYLLYGSAARGELRSGSDVDLLLDFPDDDATAAAWDYAEEEGARLGLECDIRPAALCAPRFLGHVLQEARSLP